VLLSNLRFGSFLSYSPRGDSDSAKKSRDFRDKLKRDLMVTNPAGETMPMSKFLARAFALMISETELRDFFGENISLIPAPGSSLTVAGGLRVPLRIATALASEGLGSEILDILERTSPINKSAYAASGDRPKAFKHYESISVRRLGIEPTRILIIDDFITRGATLLGAASRLDETYPSAEISAFALIRTISNPTEFNNIVTPCVGIITLRGDETRREP
jgi:phosphoribosylpyrophosphate synthetase